LCPRDDGRFIGARTDLTANGASARVKPPPLGRRCGDGGRVCRRCPCPLLSGETDSMAHGLSAHGKPAHGPRQHGRERRASGRAPGRRFHLVSLQRLRASQRAGGLSVGALLRLILGRAGAARQGRAPAPRRRRRRRIGRSTGWCMRVVRLDERGDRHCGRTSCLSNLLPAVPSRRTRAAHRRDRPAGDGAQRARLRPVRSDASGDQAHRGKHEGPVRRSVSVKSSSTRRSVD
jgi:hypothetical protein